MSSGCTGVRLAGWPGSRRARRAAHSPHGTSSGGASVSSALAARGIDACSSRSACIDAAELLRAGVHVHQLLRAAAAPAAACSRSVVISPRRTPSASSRSASRTRCASFGLMPMPTSPAYSGWRLSNVSWKRKRAAHRQLPVLGKALQRARMPRHPSRCRRRSPAGARPPAAAGAGRAMRRGAGQAVAGSTRGSTGAAVGCVSMSSGSASTTGPGRPCSAV